MMSSFEALQERAAHEAAAAGHHLSRFIYSVDAIGYRTALAHCAGCGAQFHISDDTEDGLPALRAPRGRCSAAH
jgi:hypothetical protein